MGVVYRAADRPALDGVTFELAPGQIMLVVGPSGSGKSTLALAAAGLIPGDIPATVSGTLRIDGQDAAGLGTVAIGARVGLVFQGPTSPPVL